MASVSLANSVVLLLNILVDYFFVNEGCSFVILMERPDPELRIYGSRIQGLPKLIHARYSYLEAT